MIAVIAEPTRASPPVPTAIQPRVGEPPDACPESLAFADAGGELVGAERRDAMIGRLGARNLEAVEGFDEVSGVLLAEAEVKPHLRCHLHVGDCLELEQGLAPSPGIFGAPRLAEHVTRRG